MAKYTTNFYSLMNMGIYTREDLKSWFTDYELSDYLTDEEIDVINTRGTWNKDKLADKIIDEYLFKDFGVETPAMFKHYAKIKMKNIMESKLPMIYSSAIKYNPLVNIDMTETYTSSSRGNVDSSGLSVNSDTPQGEINKSSILSGSYASNTGADENTSSSSGTMDYTKKTVGNQGIYITNQRLIKEYRDNIRAIDYGIIKELKELFIGLL